MRNIEVFPKFSGMRNYQVKWAFILMMVPAACALVLTLMLFVFAKLNLYFLESLGMLVNELVREAYYTQVQMELWSVSGYFVVLMVCVFSLGLLVMNWAVSPFANAETVLRLAVENPAHLRGESEWLSESPVFHRMIWGLAQKAKDPKFQFESQEIPLYHFNARFTIKFAAVFFTISVFTSYILGIVLDTAYGKVVSLAINLVRLDQKGHYFMAQQEVLHDGVMLTMGISCLVYLGMGIVVTRYLSTMLFVFSRGIHNSTYPMQLRQTDSYHSLSKAVNDAASAAGLFKKQAHLKSVAQS